MRTILILFATLFVAVSVSARNPVANLAGAATIASKELVSQAPVVLPDSSRRGERPEREARAQRFAARQDSLILSKNYQFLPVNMQGNGGMQLIYNYYYYVGVTPQQVEVHMPWIANRGTDLVEVLNFDASDVQNYRAEQQPDGWSVTFRAVPDGFPPYLFNMSVNTVTGHVTLTIQNAANTISYLGSLVKNDPLEQNNPPEAFP